ncbi:hypothetical protein QAD02_003656 [Eretmocerus hayati]|uniref:Uncharacterized protein n=1 Tax=Eretmocerus hayati TaxID=131215 RepID=A0ACC2NMT1_9HYME|nr:hypothetical protein QAD02_003656 [Eretmocerus hayati]
MSELDISPTEIAIDDDHCEKCSKNRTDKRCRRGTWDGQRRRYTPTTLRKLSSNRKYQQQFRVPASLKCRFSSSPAFDPSQSHGSGCSVPHLRCKSDQPGLLPASPFRATENLDSSILGSPDVPIDSIVDESEVLPPLDNHFDTPVS